MIVYLVLDTSAMLEYAGDSLDVGETITQIAEEGPSARFGLPVVCLIEAHQILLGQPSPTGVSMLAVLDAHRRSTVLPLDTRNWDQTAIAATSLGSLSRAVALATAEAHDAMLLTAEPEAYQPAFKGGRLPGYIIGC